MNLETLASWDLCTCTCDPTKHNRHFLEESLAKLSWVNTKGPGYGKRVFLRCRFILEMIILSSQARDKHREYSQKEWRFCRATWHSVSVRSSWSRLPRRYCRGSGSPSAHRSTVCGKRRVFFVLLRHSLSCGNHSRPFAKTGSEQNHRNTQLRRCLSQAAPPPSALRRTLRRPAALKRCRLHLQTFR